MADPRVSRAVRTAAGIPAVVVGAFLAVRPFAAPELMALCVSLGLAVAALVELVQLSRERPAKLTLAICFAVGSALIGLWQPVNLSLVGAVTGVLLILAGGAELWSAALLSNPHWPRLLNSPSTAGFWASLLVGGASIGLGSLAVVWVDRTLLPAAVVLGLYLLIAGLGIMVDAWAADRPTVAANRNRLVGRGLALLLGLALALAGAGLDGGRVAPGPFYSPAMVGGQHAPGKLLRADSYAGATTPGVVAARLLYLTTTAQGSPIVASAAIYLPADRVTEQLPLVVWLHDGTGLSPSCAPSVRGLASGGMSFLDQVTGAGYALLAPDLPGLGVEGAPSYLLGQPEGRAVLDALRAARQLNGVRFGEAVLWGFGEGGHAALWAGLIRDDYAPEVTLTGLAALAPLTDLSGVLASPDRGAEREAVAARLISSYAAVYPEIDGNDYLLPTARARVSETAARCQGQPGPLLPWLGSGLSWAQSPTAGALATRLAENRPDGRIPVPVLLGQGGRDQLVPTDVQDGYVAAQCRSGTRIDYRVYHERDHRGLVAPASPAVTDLLTWSSARFTGLTPTSSCG
ncbi:alpha-beta hydrolase superfamily lysophospholipase [Propionicimonas paludicola]|uniref:Alpha-beta hydrolase superfamily lysophospholipase n=1 Tax=Propionicimonas paludicola TaxID=185243 RepID=A0A2A9CRG0_9ACTN|nr:lipase family protein [Propionicimonas paludicola]PFG16958.1 alpha-beta hydrolase superfamily lysophospholipase [Propionicimonas paludicola]